MSECTNSRFQKDAIYRYEHICYLLRKTDWEVIQKNHAFFHLIRTNYVNSENGKIEMYIDNINKIVSLIFMKDGTETQFVIRQFTKGELKKIFIDHTKKTRAWYDYYNLSK